MEENINISEVVAEVKNSNEDELTETIQKWFESVRTMGMKIGATFISAAVASTLKKHLHKEGKVTLRDYKRAVEEINKIISVQLKKEEKQEETA